MHDGEDHDFPAVNDDSGDGPLACLVLSVNIRRFRHYRENGSYQELNDALHHLDQSPGWAIYTGRNQWHPFIIHKPLAQVIAGQDTADEQVDAFVADVSLVAEEVFGLPELGAFQGHLTSSTDPA